MKIEKSFSILAMLVVAMLPLSMQVKAIGNDENANLKDLVAPGEKLDSEGFQLPNPNNVGTKSNPRLRPVEIIQPDEYIEYGAAGLIPNPYQAGYVTQGWLVNGCVVIAPRHAIIDKGYVDKDLTNIQVDFKVGYQGKGSFKQQVKIKPISCGRGNKDDEITNYGDEDFCIFKADRSLKGLIKPIKIGAIDYQRYSVVPATSVGFFPQASKTLDVLAKDVNAKIVDGDSSYLESRAANLSGAGLIDIDEDTHDKHIIGLQVGYFKVGSSQLNEQVSPRCCCSTLLHNQQG